LDENALPDADKRLRTFFCVSEGGIGMLAGIACGGDR